MGKVSQSINKKGYSTMEHSLTINSMDKGLDSGPAGTNTRDSGNQEKDMEMVFGHAK